MPNLDWYIRANLNLRHPRLLKALDDLRHIGRVASHLNVSQPAVSKALSQLEASLGHPVFDRKGHRLVATESGEVLLCLARDVLDRLAVAREELRDINEGKITRISLGVLPSAAISVVPNFIAKLEAASSDVAANVFEGITLASYLEAQGSVQVLDLVPPVSVRVGLIFMADRRTSRTHQLIIRLLRETAAETWKEPPEAKSG